MYNTLIQNLHKDIDQAELGTIQVPAGRFFTLSGRVLEEYPRFNGIGAITVNVLEDGDTLKDLISRLTTTQEMNFHLGAYLQEISSAARVQFHNNFNNGNVMATITYENGTTGYQFFTSSRFNGRPEYIKKHDGEKLLKLIAINKGIQISTSL